MQWASAKKLEKKGIDTGRQTAKIGPVMANPSSQFVSLFSILHGILSCATKQEYNDPALQVAGMEMIGVCATPAPSFDKRVRQVAEYLELNTWDIHVIRRLIPGHANPIDYYYISKKHYNEIVVR